MSICVMDTERPALPCPALLMNVFPLLPPTCTLLALQPLRTFQSLRIFQTLPRSHSDVPCWISSTVLTIAALWFVVIR